MASKNNKRKYAAVVLGIVGIAGLSLASAATLGVTQESPLVGVSLTAECDTAVNVDYTTAFNAGATPNFSVSSINVTDISDECDGDTITVHVLNNSGTQVGTATGTLDDSGVANLTPAAALNAANVYEIAVAIS